jgi:arylformamidase
MNKNPIFLSYYLSETTPVYGGEKGAIRFEKIRSIEKSDNSNNLKLTFPAHVGTHIDFPFHFSMDGKKCEDYPPAFWVFHKVGYLNCMPKDVMSKLSELDNDIELLILKTEFGKLRMKEEYWSNQPIIPANFAQIFKMKFPLLRVFGFDLISLTSKLNREEGKSAHINFLINHNILVLEDMNLENLKEAPSTVLISPLLVKGADGVPCTVFAF